MVVRSDSDGLMGERRRCGECGKKEFIKIVDLEKTESETEESVTYQHQCSECNHKIADHEYTFTIDGEYQVPQLEVVMVVES